MRILATGPSGAAEALDPLRAADLAAVLAEADVVSLHCTLTGETRGLIGEKELRRMKPTAILINTAPGEAPAHVVNPDAIVRWRRTP